MSKSHNHGDGECNCHAVPVNPSVVQNLDEMQFERSVFQAAIDDNVTRISSIANGNEFDVNATDSYGYTALHYAARNNSLKAAKLLVQLGAKINLQTTNLGATALHRAVTANKLEMVKYLVSIGADMTVKDSDGLCPLDRAVRDGRNEMISILKTF